MKTTTVIKLWGGPGVGKTTCALRVSGELSIQVGPKKSVEYVSEYAKQLVWRGDFKTLAHQPSVTKGQLEFLAPIGRCDYIVTDSPIQLGLLYSKQEHYKEVEDLINTHKNNNPQKEIHIILTRDRNDFQEEGRVHNLEESIEIDQKILEMFESSKMPYIQVSNTISPSDLCRIILRHYE